MGAVTKFMSLLKLEAAPLKPSYPVLREEALVAQIEKEKAVTKAAEALSVFLSGTTLREVLQTQVVHNALSGMLQGLASADGRKAMDARTINQNATEIAHVIEQTIKKVTSHAISRKGVPEEEPQVLSGEELSGYPEEE